MYAEQIRPFVKAPYLTLGTDGYGRSDTRAQLREFFEVSAPWIVLSTVWILSQENYIEKDKVQEVMKLYKLDSKKEDPRYH